MRPIDPRYLVGVVATQDTQLVVLQPRRAVRRWRRWLAQRLIDWASRLAGVQVTWRS